MITTRAIFDQPSLKYSVKILFHHQRLLVIVMMLSFTEDVWEFQNYQIAPEFLKRKVGLQKWTRSAYPLPHPHHFFDSYDSYRQSHTIITSESMPIKDTGEHN